MTPDKINLVMDKNILEFGENVLITRRKRGNLPLYLEL
jgi:hypothetical protein